MAAADDPRRGRPLADVPARPDPAAWGDWPRPMHRLSTGSTMSDVDALAAAGSPEGSVVVAEEQTAGRGRRGRSWDSRRGDGLWLSILLRPPADAALDIGLLPLVAGGAIARALAGEAPDAGIAVKWPNDIVVDRGCAAAPAKLGGLLAERRADGAVVLGIGLNVWQRIDEVPEGGTSWAAEGLVDRVAPPGADPRGDPGIDPGIDPVRTRLLTTVLEALAVDYADWRSGTWALAGFRERCLTLGRPVRALRSGQPDLLGVASAVDDHGRLVVSSAEGDVVLLAGEVSIRPA